MEQDGSVGIETALEPEVARQGEAVAAPSHGPELVAADVVRINQRIVNLYLVGREGAGDREWVLVDAGLYGTAGQIAKEAARRFGPGSRPAAIVLTHGHFDHVGALKELAALWDAPVYAHELELPYLTGRSAYPPPDPTVGGGAMARLSFLYPKRPIVLKDGVRALEADGVVPGMPDWRWIPTPGHSPGHVSFYRESDGLLLAGDAFITTKQESMLAVLAQREEIHGPPMYFTPDWEEARRSVERLALLRPEIAATGHGTPMRGATLREGLDRLAAEFDRLAVPAHGRYVNEPAYTDVRGVVTLPRPVSDPTTKVIAGAALALVAGLAISALRSRDQT